MPPAAFATALDKYVSTIRSIRAGPPAHPETSLYPAIQGLLDDTVALLPGGLKATQQPSTAVGAPDFVFARLTESFGFLEAKAPAKNIDALGGDDRRQVERYLLLDNWILTNFHQFILFEEGVETDRAVLGPSSLLLPRSKGTPSAAGVDSLWRLLNRLATHRGATLRSAPQVAIELARATALTKHAVVDHLELTAGKKPPTPLQELLAEYRKLLIGDISEQGFADAYAQTVAFGLLIARYVSGKDVSTTTAHTLLGGIAHDLIGAALQLAAHPATTQAIGWATEVLARVTNRVDTARVFKRSPRRPDPLLYFYEDFLKTYDPALRRLRGAYYTPHEVVDFQSRAIEEALGSDLGIAEAFMDPQVHLLDPATGTGTYLLRIIERTAELAKTKLGPAAQGPAIDELLTRLYGFEYLIGPYTVAHLRLAAAATERGAALRPSVSVYLTDTLQQAGRPGRPGFGFMSKPLADERTEADQVKKSAPILVIFGNPPYGRGKRERGTWIDKLMDRYRVDVDPVEAKSLEENYARFIRWACLRLGDEGDKPAILSFITNKSYLTGPAFAGLRRHLRTSFEKLYVLNLNGNLNRRLHGPSDENIFQVQVGVAILVAIRAKKPTGLAEVFYDTWTGGAQDKLDRLAAASLATIPWVPVIRPEPTDPLVPLGSSVYEDWPKLDDCFLNRFSGVETGRDQVVVAATQDQLRAKIDGVYMHPAGSEDRRNAFRENRNRKAADIKGSSYDASRVREYAYRPYDVEFLYDDPDFITWPRPDLRQAWGADNTALVTVYPIVSGPAAVVVGQLPDRHIYIDGAAVYPLHAGSATLGLLGDAGNLRAEYVDLLTATYGRPVTSEEAFYWIVAVLSAPAFSDQFKETLEYERPRVPLTADPKLFTRGVDLGKRISVNQTKGVPYPGGSSLSFHGSGGTLTKPRYNDPDLQITDTTLLRGVSAAEWGYTISRYPVISQWLEQRKGVPLTFGLQKQIAKLAWTVRLALALEDEANTLLADLLSKPTISGATLRRAPARTLLFGGRRTASTRPAPRTARKSVGRKKRKSRKPT